MRKTTSRVLWILVGVLLVITGIACFAHPAATLGSLAILLGIAMLFSGVVDLVIFATAHDAMYGSGWFLLGGHRLSRQYGVFTDYCKAAVPDS